MAYRFGTGAPLGLWLGLGFSRFAVLAAGLLATVLLLAMRTGLLIGAAPLLVAAAVTVVPIGGRPLAGWAAPAAGQGAAIVSGATGWTAPLPDAPLAGAPAGWVSGRRLRLPAECGRFRLFDAADPAGGWPVGVLREPRSAAATFVFSVAGPDRFGLLDSGDQDRLVAGWGRALTGLAHQERGLRVQLLHWVTTVESDLDESRRWAAARGVEPSQLSTLDAIVDAASVLRDSLLVVRLPSVRSGCDPLARARDVAGQLLAAELVARPLDSAGVAGLVSHLLTPGDGNADGGPVSRRTSWDHVRTDDCWHRSFAVSAWPGSPVPAGWLSSLLLAAPPAGSWVTAVHLGAVAPQVANRLARAARAKAELDRADRARLGMSASAAADKAVVEAAGMDAELVAGHATYRLAAVLTCSAASVDELEESARGLRDAAVNAGLSVRPLHGQHHLGLAATLPLCRLRFGGAA